MIKYDEILVDCGKFTLQECELIALALDHFLNNNPVMEENKKAINELMMEIDQLIDETKEKINDLPIRDKVDNIITVTFKK